MSGVAKVDSIQDITREQLQVIKETKTHDSKIIADLKKRKLLNVQKVISFKISKGPKFALEMVREETDLTADMLVSGAWKTATFSMYHTLFMLRRYSSICGIISMCGTDD